MTTPLKKDGTPKKPSGRPVGSVNVQTLRQSKLKNLLLRHLEPLTVEAITTTAEIMRDEKATPTIRLQASKFIIEKVADLIDQSYRKEKDQESEPTDDVDESDKGAILSFTVVPKKA